jgi:nitroimidazol reductase NimA-like FMN-containing flavoprotein (pyridoxamine 5'-phosphate oxidase superfamily)
MQGILSDRDIDALLSGQSFGHLACSDKGKPYIVPMAYVFHNNALYGQTTEGKKVDILRRNPLVCFQVEDVSGNGWRSAQCWGTFEELDFAALQQPQAVDIVRMLTKHIASIQQRMGVTVPFGPDGQAAVDQQGRRATVFRIAIQEKTGRWYAADTESASR